MKKIILIAMLCVCAISFSQEKMISKSGKVTFEASVPSFEEVKAVNKNVTFVLNPATGEIASLALMKGFQFKVALMEEHFNENYIESHRYPKAVFKGKVQKFDLKNVDEIEKEYDVKGKLYLHGKSKIIEMKALIKRVPDGIQISCNYPISVSDFNIEIPSVVASKISKTANTNLLGVVKSEDMKYLTLK